MRGYMFKNRWGALLFVCLTAIGAASIRANVCASLIGFPLES